MPHGSIEKIKHAEARALQQITKAKEDAETAIQKAEQQGINKQKQLIQQTKQKIEQQKKENLEEIKKEVTRIIKKNKTKLSSIEQQATPHIDDAVSYIIKAITEEE